MDTQPRPVIIDTDPGIDDALAILYALHSRNVQVKAITTVHGNVSAKQTYANCLEILNFIQQYEAHAGVDVESEDETVQVPAKTFSRGIWVSKGAEAPYGKTLNDMQHHAAHVHGEDGLGGILSKRKPSSTSLQERSQSAVEALYHISERAAVDEWFHQLRTADPQTITLVLLGPVTNLAYAIDRDDMDLTMLKRFKEIIIMGGCVHSPCPGGNITPHAEFNFYADPVAADIVVKSSLPVTLVPLDATETCRLRYDTFRDILTPIEHSSPLPTFVASFIEHLFAFMDSMYEDDSFDLLHADEDLPGRLAIGNEQRISGRRGRVEFLRQFNTNDGIEKTKQTVIGNDEKSTVNRNAHISFAMHDPLAMGVFIDPSIVILKKSVKMRVETCEQAITVGMCCVDGRRWKVREPAAEPTDALKHPDLVDVVFKVDTTKFFTRFMHTVFGVHWDESKHSWIY